VTYLEDFARALITLGQREEALGQVWHVPSPPPVSLRWFVEMVFQEVGAPPRLRAAPRWGITAASWFSPTVRAVREQLYQHERPWVVDCTKFERAFGWEATPLPEAIKATAAWYRNSGQRTSM
jgi:nucleoside-diphosphate-sugar epimerase